MMQTCECGQSYQQTDAACPKCGRPTPPAPPVGGMPTIVGPIDEVKVSTPSNQARTKTGSFPLRIDGYEIISSVGAGGMGTVYLAYEPLMDRFVALKLLTSDANDVVQAEYA